ncbi:MAG: CRISPR-associated endonuclease Cas1 [Bifidobacteriaceae bacterium]|nr:CRISPR-associated endonuclease Cas1 [Bifidobacteriaceae bacterium]
MAGGILDRSYAPGNLNQVRIPKDGGGFRVLDVPPVADRVVERCLLKVVTPHVDPSLSQAAYGFRPGLGAADAVQRVALLRDDGMTWALRSDVDECFPSLPGELAVQRLLELLPDHSVEWLVKALVGRRTATRRGLRDVQGLAQGSALSPLLCNLVLRDLDESFAEAGHQVVRYADDFTVVGRSEANMRQARAVAEAAVRRLGMRLEPSKTEIMSFREGFCFLGEDFGPKYPPALPDHRIDVPSTKVLYVGVSGSRVRVKNGRVIVTSKDDLDLLDVPSSHLERLVLFGPVGLSAGARAWLLWEGLETVFVSKRGSFAGVLSSVPSSLRAERLRAQVTLAPDHALGLARSLIESKLRHQATLIQRFAAPEFADDLKPKLEMVRRMTAMCPLATSAEELMGLEGASAKSYFEALSMLVPAELSFPARSRRPPLDLFNAALGYAYAVLLGECVSALMAAGLEPSLGVLHSDHDKRPSLALDLMEEFRPYVVDQVVMRLCRSGSLTAGHAKPGKGPGVLLTKAGKGILLDAYERRMLQVTRGALPGFAGSIRRHLYRQAQRIALHLADAEYGWTGLSWR